MFYRSVFKLCGYDFPADLSQESQFDLEDTIRPAMSKADLDQKQIGDTMGGVDSSMEWAEKKKHLTAAGITPRNIPPVRPYKINNSFLDHCGKALIISIIVITMYPFDTNANVTNLLTRDTRGSKHLTFQI